jgi:hypothetical protein
MSAPVFFLTLALPLTTILLVFGMKYFSSFHQARARLADQQSYRELLERSAAAQTKTADALTIIQASLEDLRARVTSIETVLKDVG